MNQVNLSTREVSIILAALEYWGDNHDDDDPDDRMDQHMEQVTFGTAGQPQGNEIVKLCRKLYPFGSDEQPVWRS
jgi:hypothetical protein